MKQLLHDIIRMTSHLPGGSTIKIAAILLVLYGCNSTRSFDDRAFMAQLTPVEWRQQGVWYFDVFDNQQRSLGHIVLFLTGEPVGTESCVDDYWQRAVVLDNKLDIDTNLDILPAYNLKGSHLTVELTASSCSVHHRFLGDATSDGAVGGFHILHSLDGIVAGTFVARSVTD
jgi:hypothetical protein